MIDYREDALWNAYLHILPKAITGYEHDMYYVGITRLPPSERWGSNGCNYYRKKDKEFFGNIIDKYGWDNIEHEVIASNLTADEARAFEKTMILALKSHGKYGYNYTDGGDCSSHVTPATAKKVFQFDTHGKYISTYDSVQEASRNVGLSAAAICKYAQGKSKLQGNTLYLWAYEDAVIFVDGEYRLKDESMIRYKLYQFDLYGNYIARYTSIAEAARENNIDYDTLYNQTHGKSMRKLTTKHKYLWRKAESVYFKDGTYHIKVIDFDNTAGRKVYQFDANGIFIAKYNTIKEASQKTGIMNGTIQYRASHKSTLTILNDGVIFRYSEDVQELENGSYLMLR